MTYAMNQPGIFDDVTVSGATITVGTSGIYSINNLTVGSSNNSNFYINDGVSAMIIVRGNVTINSNCKIQLNGATPNSHSMSRQCHGQRRPQCHHGHLPHGLFGGSAGGTIQLANTGCTMYGAIYAPQHALTMQTGSPKFFGAVAAKSITIKDSAAFHFDEALRSLRFSNLSRNTGTSSPTSPAQRRPRSADYLVNITGGPGIQH